MAIPKWMVYYCFHHIIQNYSRIVCPPQNERPNNGPVPNEQRSYWLVGTPPDSVIISNSYTLEVSEKPGDTRNSSKSA